MNRCLSFGLLLLLVLAYPATYAQDPLQKSFSGKWHHNYSQALVMKMFNCAVDSAGKPRVYITFEQTLNYIRAMDNLTLGVPKIIYLVGWQYNGHDDKYPAFFEVNEALKRKEDKTARESLLWLMREAKKYHTTISLHINITDAYDNSPLWDEYVKNDLLAKNEDGTLMQTGVWNNHPSYHILAKREWETGIFQKRLDKLLELLPPLQEAGTIHIDAWIARGSKGHHISQEEEISYMWKIGEYFMSKGIDVSTERTDLSRYLYGLCPHFYHYNGHTQDDYLAYPASFNTGSNFNPDLNGDKNLKFLFGTSMHGETVFPRNPTNKTKITEENWTSYFADEFYENSMQYFFLNTLKRLGVKNTGNNRVALFSGNVNVSLADSIVKRGDFVLRNKSFMYFPAVWRNDHGYIVYSRLRGTKLLQRPAEWASAKTIFIYRVSAGGLEFEREEVLNGNKFTLEVQEKLPLYITPQKLKQ
ncbi:endo-alpha-N-acetylgalactosaminidase family protein [Flavihumibacter fluvii]|uniref:endo-alpha-N-acetylgalactosaminidase family protein n=1 Tax=Flavihumibacter fluvii TaxID=2838157 RepID=UPI001BDE8F7D|nr:endo-alpha-N-acetylgalactosaminidase family protein [Flavihumibacter fluvii]ULQ53406.1 endo-alpha-N-acetylgalactosaminidase family protein [Flavihumibacter fluvii]